MIADKPYVPVPGSLAAHAIAFIKARLHDQPTDVWVRNTEVCAFLGVATNVVWPSLKAAIAAGVVERSTSSHGYTQWRLVDRKPPRKRKSFQIDWPPGFEPQYDTVYVPAWEGRR